MTLLEILKRFKFSIGLILLFILIENLSWIVEPTYFGKLLDALIDRFYDNEKKVDYLLPLFMWVVIYLVNVGGGALSRLFSGGIYSRIYAEVATKIITHSRDQDLPMSLTIARAELAKDYITFLKERLPEITWQLAATFGAIGAMFFYDWRIASVCLFVILPIILINHLYHKYVKRHQKVINDKKESLFRIFEQNDLSLIKDYYYSLIQPQRRISMWNALDFGVIKFILMLIFIVVIFICIDVDKFSTGKIFAVVAYLWTFISSTEYIPTLMEGIISVRDLSSRMKGQEPAISTTDPAIPA